MIQIRAVVRDGHTSIVVDGHQSVSDDQNHHAAHGRVCAAVSAVSRTALLGLEQIALRHPLHVNIEISEEET